MRIPTTAEFLALFAATGQLSDISRMPDTDSEFSLLQVNNDEPQCNPGRFYHVNFGDTCNHIGALHNAPTYQIICENNGVNGQGTNLVIGENLCLGRKGQDCDNTYVAQWPYTNAKAIAKKFHIDLDVFEDNNYCYGSGSGKKCPPFNQETVVCVANKRIGKLPKCDKIF